MTGAAFTPAEELARQIRARETSPREVVELFLARCHLLNPRLHALLTIAADEAIAAADRATDAIAAGAALGPLQGVPFVVKDLEWTQGIRTTMGSLAYRDFVPKMYATCWPSTLRPCVGSSLIDPGLDLVRIGGAVAERRVDLRAGHDPVASERLRWVFDASEVIDPHRDLRHVRSVDQPSAAARRPVTEGDHRMLLAAGAFLGVAAQAIGERLPCSGGGQLQLLGQTIVEAHGHVHGHELQCCTLSTDGGA
ncbi:MAG: amidase family protein [Solirubrobacteraceae bacterium]